MNIRWDFIKTLKDYDIVLVKMSDDEIKSRNISESHQKRPFIIIGFDDDKRVVSGYYLTGNISNHCFFKKEKYSGFKLILNKDNYKFHKNGIVLFQKEIKLPYENLIHLLDHINKHDLNILKKYIKLYNKEVVFSYRGNNIIEIGDIVLYKESSKYIIYQVDANNCYGYGIKKHSDNLRVYLADNPNYILFDNKFYYIDFSDTKVFTKNSNIHIIDRFNKEIVDVVRENKKKLVIKRRKLNKVNIHRHSRWFFSVAYKAICSGYA